MEEYLITIAADQQKRGLTDKETAYCVSEYDKWAKSLSEKHLFARRLSMQPGVLLPSKRTLVTDGPFAEAKELIAGIIVIKAASYEDAESITNACPLINYFQLFLKKVE